MVVGWFEERAQRDPVAPSCHELAIIRRNGAGGKAYIATRTADRDKDCSISSTGLARGARFTPQDVRQKIMLP
jgi:hypothetical protein